jgi:peptide/nickel transport system permease protein
MSDAFVSRAIGQVGDVARVGRSGGSPLPADLTAEQLNGAPRQRSLFRRLAIGIWEDKSALAGLILVLLILGFSFIGPLVYHTDQVHTNLTAINLAPSVQHPLGTDDLGYDMLGRLMVGGQSSMEIGLAVAALATTLGTIWGSLAALSGGVLDTVMMRIVDVLLAIPGLFIVIFLATAIHPDVWTLIGVIAVISWLVPSRLVRGESLSIRTLSYVEAARGFGARQHWTLRRHIIPNAIGVIVVNATFQVADAVLTLAYLSFLGFGLPPPAASWGGILSEGLNNMYNGYWWEIYPAGIIVVITVIGFNLLGDALRNILDARLQER